MVNRLGVFRCVSMATPSLTIRVCFVYRLLCYFLFEPVGMLRSPCSLQTTMWVGFGGRCEGGVEGGSGWGRRGRGDGGRKFTST